MENERYLEKQEILYYNSEFLDSQWYRSIYGGKWRLVKFGRDTPYIVMFCIWTKMGDDCFEGYFEVLKTEVYLPTNVDTKRKLRIAILKYFGNSILKFLHIKK
jgi:hypothetical protein